MTDITEQLAEALRALINRIGARWFLEQNWADPLDALAAYETSKALATPGETGFIGTEQNPAPKEWSLGARLFNELVRDRDPLFMGAGSITAPSTEGDAGLRAASGSAPATPAQGQDIEGLVEVAVHVHSDRLVAGDNLREAMCSALLAVQQKLRGGE